MSEFKYVKEYLNTGTGTEGSLLIVKKIYDKLWEETEKALIPRSEASVIMGPDQIPGSSVDLDLESPNTMDVRKIAEGAEIFLDQQGYTSINFKPEKYGVGIRITKEMMEDAKWNLLEKNLKAAGKRMAENENSLVRSALNTGAANTVSGGAQLTVGNITEAMQYLEDSDYEPTTMFVGMEVLNDLRNIDLFTKADSFGNREMLQRGIVGEIYGMKVIKVSTNAGYTTTDVFITDREHAYGIAEKRPVTIENVELPTYDMRGATVTHRIVVKSIRDAAICKITTT